MKVTIGVPVYNVEQFIERCAISVFEQTYKDLDIIFVDDCSPDRSILILGKIIEKYPERINQTRVIRHEYNQGLAAVRNTIVEHSSGDYIIWVDGDDYVDYQLVELCVDESIKSNSDIILFDFHIITKRGDSIAHHKRFSSIRERTNSLLMRQTYSCIWAGMYKLALYKNNGVVAVEGINNNEDYQVTPQLSYFSQSLSYLGKPLYYYDCTNEKSITHSFNSNIADQGWRSIDVLTDFFKDKGDDYLDSIEVARINRLATYLKYSIQAGNRDYYDYLRIKQHEIGKLKEECVPLYMRVYLNLRNYYALKLYTTIASFILKFYRN